MKKKSLNKKNLPAFSVIAVFIAGALILKLIADSQSRVDY